MYSTQALSEGAHHGFCQQHSSVVKEANSVAGFGLDPQFAETLSELLSRCRAAGLDFRISQGLRTPQKQAEYYCKWVRRSPADIDAAARKMERDGAPWLASVLKSYRNIPRQQNWLTSQLPGSGWHQWGLAADCYCYRNGHMVENGSDPAYRFYAEQAVRLGLTAGYYFPTKTRDMYKGHQPQAQPTCIPGSTSTA
jgi:peptidoglycan LD-endopeptidase CwlK